MELKNLTLALGIAAAILNGIGFLIYNIQTKIGQSKPNPVSWSIWSLLSTVNAFSYRAMSRDLVAALQFFAGSVGCILTFLYVLGIGKFSRPKPRELGVLVLGLVAILVWWEFRSATSASLIILASFLVSSKPTFDGVLQDPFTEKPTAWVIWALAFSVGSVNVFLRKGLTIELATPISLVIVHGTIAFLSRKKRKDGFLNRLPAAS